MYLVDTNILLRFLLKADPSYHAIRETVGRLKREREFLATTAQNIAEFWNVCTRPSTSRGGLGLSVDATEMRLRLIERHFQVLPDSPTAYREWRYLVTQFGVQGVQVHDARLVAAMRVHNIPNILTQNGNDFKRFPGINVVSPTMSN